jgi:hypothetical protein
MKNQDFIFLDVKGLLDLKFRSANGAERWKKVAIAFATTKRDFFVETGLLRQGIEARSQSVQDLKLQLSDLTEEGQDFLFWEKDSWLGACDRKSNDLLRKGATDEERLAVYADPKGLYRRLDKFRKERAAKAN